MKNKDKDMSENNPIQFGLRSIQTDEFATITETTIVEEQIRIGWGLGFSADDDKAELKTTFRAAFQSNESPFIILQVTCVFGIDPKDFAKFPRKEENIVSMPKEFVVHLASLVIGTARGILHEKLENTSFKQFLLPIIDASTVVIPDIILEKSMELK